MEIWRNITFSSERSITKKLTRLGFTFGGLLVQVKVRESDPRWPEVRQLLTVAERASEMCSTDFTPEECRAARWLEVDPEWHYGYPQPELDRGYQRETYDEGHYCGKCRIGKMQKAPFLIRGEPKWGRRRLFQLNWVFDEYFCERRTYDTCLKHLGVGAREVLHYKSRTPQSTVVQLIADPDVLVELDLPRDHEYEICPTCGKVKFHHMSRGYAPALRQPVPDDVPIFKSRQWFGSGGSAFRAVLVSNAVYRAIADNHLRGITFNPVAERPPGG